MCRAVVASSSQSFKNCPTKPVQANFNFTRVGTSGRVRYGGYVWRKPPSPGQDLNPDLQVSGKADKARLVTSWPLFSVQFQGLWYELRRQPNAFEPDSVCVTGDVAVTPQGGLTIVNRWYNTVSSQHVLLNGVLRRANNDSQDGRLIVKFTNTNTDVEYSVLGTDYDNYLVVWSCWASSVVNGVPQYTGYSWVLGRNKVLSQEALDAVSSIETSHNIDRTLYEDTRHDNCPINSSS
uniref:Lipocalin/cytosolic fatty-acid binding domain-containing protein n=1 Tax=Timema shepardi TaxID=629360 RepID=A0A7R9AYL3_TIMSH|nr:unnamed protein product [Timema shepardi]